MKPTVILLLLAAFILPVEAKKKRGNGARDKQEEQQKKKEKAERERKRDAVNDYLDKKDKNEDGMVTRDEHLAGEVDQEVAGRKFDAANKNRDRSLTRSEIENLLGL
jgi:Flp pilus assembly protein TadB